MKQIKKKILTTICGAGLLLGSGGLACSNINNHFQRSKENFNPITTIHPIYINNKTYYGVEAFDVKNQRKNLGQGYEGNANVSYLYATSAQEEMYLNGLKFKEIDKDGDGWIKVHNMLGQGSYEIPKGDINATDASYKEIPGNPKSIPFDFYCMLAFVVDFDKDEEYASGVFANKEDAYKWADNMVEYFKSKN